MPTFILNTVGTSLLYKDWSSNKKGLPETQSVVAQLNELESTDRKCGAEINSLQSLLSLNEIAGWRLDPPYYLAFLVSDTDEGKWVGEVLKRYNESGKRDVSIKEVKVVAVEGLQPDDPKRFANEGLRNLVKHACRLLNKESGKTRIINATGGFKAQISFAGLIGQAIQVPVVYMFETFPFCIQMPPMPVDFNRDLWLAHYKILESGGMTVASKKEFIREVDKTLLPLFDHETDGEQHIYTITPVLELMHQSLKLHNWGYRPQEPTTMSSKSPEEKVSLNESEMPHSPKSSLKVIKQLSEFPWVEKVQNITFLNTQRSHLLNKVYPDNNSAIGIVHSDGDMGLEIKLTTTCESDPELAWCKNKLNEMLNS